MASPTNLNFHLVVDYEPNVGKGIYTDEQVISALRSAHKHLKLKGDFTSDQMNIAKYAFNNLDTLSQESQNKIKKIQNYLKADHPLSERKQCTSYASIKNIFFQVNQNKIIIDPASTDAMSQELFRLSWIEFYNTRWIMLGVTMEELSNEKQDEKLNSDTATPEIPTTLPPLQVIPDPNLEIKLMCYNETSGKLEAQTKSLRQNQKDIITSFGHALFNDYILESVQWVKSRFIALLKDEYLPKQVSALTAKSHQAVAGSPNTPPPANPSLFKRVVQNQTKHMLASLQDSHAEIVQVLITQAKHSLAGIHETLHDVLQDPELRKQFPELIFSYIPAHIVKEMSPQTRKLVNFLLTNYVPEIMEAGTLKMQSILSNPVEAQKLGEHLAKLCHNASDYQVGLVELFSYVLQNNIPEPVEAATEALQAKLKDPVLNAELTVLLKTILLDSFFPKPSNVTETNKKLIVSILASLKLFLGSLTDAIASQALAPASLPNPGSQVASIMYQQLFTNGGILEGKTGDLSINFNIFYIRAMLEDLFLMIIFPGTQHTNATYSQKIIIMTITAFTQNVLSDIFKPATLQIIFEKILTDPLLLENPFELDQPSMDFAADDREFSKNLDIHIKAITEEVIKLIDNFLVRKAGEKLLNFIPNLGARIQRELNKIFNSGVSLVPVLYPLQILYKLKKVDPVKVPASLSPIVKTEIRLSLLQTRFFKTLEEPRVPSLKHVIYENPGEAANRQKRVDQFIFNKADRLEQIIESALPFGSRDVSAEIIRKLYLFSKEDLILKILLIYIINGLKNGLAKS